MKDNFIINSMLDNDLYKLSMMNFALELFPDTIVTYKFKNRGNQQFTPEFLINLRQQLNNLAEIQLTNEEYSYLKEKLPYLTPGYIEYLKNYRFNPSNISAKLTADNNLDLEIKGKWVDTILFEVPVMAIISELYFKIVDTNWNDEGQYDKAYYKADTLNNEKCYYADFGTRRRRSFSTQDLVLQGFMNNKITNNNSTFVGSSNVFFAMKYGIKPIGTYGHEIPQAMQSLESLNHSNYYSMQNWAKLFNTELGIALTDTVTTDMFLQNFNRRFAMLFSGVRHDSGCPFVFTDKIIKHYKSLNIDPMSKTIIFSDGLNIEKAIEIKKYCEGKIKCSFGIGTFMTNSFEGSPALNMVIKLWDVNGFPVVKLSDTAGKKNGDPTAVDTMKWIVKNQLKGLNI